MNKRPCLVFAACLLVPLSAWAAPTWTSEAECGEIRLDKPPGVVASLPTYDQTGTGFCTSYTVANLFNASIVSKYGQSKALVSPLSINMQYGYNNGRRMYAGFEVAEMVNQARQFKYCPGADINKDFLANDGAVVSGLVACYEEAQAVNGSSAKNAALVACIGRRKILKTSGLTTRLRGLEDERMDIEFTAKVLDSYCPVGAPSMTTLDLRPGYVTNASAFDRRDNAMTAMTRTLHATLAQKGLPGAITYCRKILREGNVNYLAEDNSRNTAACPIGHTSIVVGRRWARFNYLKDGETKRAGVCEFLIRDSYGTDCTSPAFDRKHLDRDRDFRQPEPAQTCDSGQVWIPEALLMRNTLSVLVMSPGL